MHVSDLLEQPCNKPLLLLKNMNKMGSKTLFNPVMLETQNLLAMWSFKITIFAFLGTIFVRIVSVVCCW